MGFISQTTENHHGSSQFIASTTPNLPHQSLLSSYTRSVGFVGVVVVPNCALWDKMNAS